MSEINNESGYYKALKIAGTVLLKIFLAPGRILLWNRYMYAKPGSILCPQESIAGNAPP